MGEKLKQKKKIREKKTKAALGKAKKSAIAKQLTVAMATASLFIKHNNNNGNNNNSSNNSNDNYNNNSNNNDEKQ